MVLIYSGDWNQGTTNIQRKVCSLREWRTNMPLSGSCSFQTSRGPPSTCSTWSPLSWHWLLPKVNRSSSHPWICLNTLSFALPQQRDWFKLKIPGSPLQTPILQSLCCSLGSCTFKTPRGDFPGSPVVKTLNFQCREHGFNSWSGS